MHRGYARCSGYGSESPHTVGSRSLTAMTATQPLLRRATHATVLWCFGIATTVLLVGLWGRAVSVDEATLSESASAVLSSGLVHERVHDWVDGSAATISSNRLADAVLDHPRVVASLDDAVDTLVAAVLAPPERAAAVDVGSMLDTLAPGVVEALASEGVHVDVQQVHDALDIELVVASQGMVEGAASSVQRTLTRVVVIAGLGMVAFGSLAVGLADQRRRQVRSLLNRIAVSALSFAVMLRVGAWAVDPNGGRSAIGAGSAVVLASNGAVLWWIGASAAVAALLVARRRFRSHPRPPARAQYEPTGSRV